MIKFWAGATACLVGLCAGYGLAARNSSGTYSKLFTFSPGSVINSTNMNSQFSDLETEMSDSKSRSGKGDFSAPVRGADGTVAAPTWSYTSETGSGLYRIGSSDHGFSMAGTKVGEWTANGYRTANGAVATPSLSFFNDTGSGLYRAGSNDIRFAVNGADKTWWTATGFGVGVTAAFPLDVQYSSSAGTYTGETALQLKNTSTANSAGIRLIANRDWELATPGSAGNPAGGFAIRDNTSAANPISIDNTDKTTITNLAIGASGTATTQMNFGSCTLNGGTPSTCTATVLAGAKCVTTYVGTTAIADGIQVNLVTTTLTVTGANASTKVVNYICFG